MSSWTKGGLSSAGLGKSKLRLGSSAAAAIGRHPRQRLDPRLGLLGGARPGRVASDIILQPGALRRLVGAGRFELGEALGALLLERVVAAGIEGQPAGLEVEDVVGDVVQQVALVADDQHRRPIALEEILEPQSRLEIEMVRRLVEEQQVRSREEQRGERHAHPPAAREAVERPLLHLLVEAEPDQDPRRAGRSGMGADRVQPVVDVAEAVRVVRRLGLVEQPCALDVGGEHRLEREWRRRRGSPGRYSRASPRAASRPRRRPDRAAPPPPASGSTCPPRCARSARRARPGGSEAVAPSRMVRPPRRTVMALRLSMRRP
jgi:hypothetical protein